MQKAQPTTLAHHYGAYFEMFKRDRLRMADIYERMNYCPLGAGALAGTTYPLDREYTAELLGFTGPTLKQHGFRFRPGLSDRVFVCLVYNHDALKPFQRGDYYLELQRVSVCGNR